MGRIEFILLTSSSLCVIIFKTHNEVWSMAIVKQTDKRSGITYAYESTYWWDKEKQQSRCKRTLIGRLDPATGEIVPTDGRCRKENGASKSQAKPQKRGRSAVTKTRRMYYGAVYLLECFCEQLGLDRDLRTCFPDTYKQLLSIAFYLVLEDNNPLYRFEKWNTTHKHPYGEDIPSPRSSELFATITDAQINQFFQLQGKRRLEDEYWAYDSTSISSYSETLAQVQYGHNKEDDRLPQLNLLLVFGEKSGLPFYYRKLSGNIPDSKTVKRLLEELNVLGFDKTKFVMDRGFYSAANINGMYKEHIKFLVGVRLSLKLVKTNLDAVYDDIRMFQHFDEGENTYCYAVMTEWDYAQDRPYKGDVLKDKRRVYLHLYYSIDRGAELESAFDKKIAGLYRELKEDKRVEGHEKDYAKYFTVTKTPVRGTTVTVKEDVVREARRYMGYFALISNEKMDAFTALHIYKMKDIVEKAFGNIKERLNMRRMLVSSERGLSGKLFVEFVALILISHLNQKMKKSGLYRQYSMNQLLDKLDVIECFEDPGFSLHMGELLSAQQSIFTQLDVPAPSSL